jgi:hypothetical protein
MTGDEIFALSSFCETLMCHSAWAVLVEQFGIERVEVLSGPAVSRTEQFARACWSRPTRISRQRYYCGLATP